MSRKSISVWMYLCRAPRYFRTKCRSESLIPSLVRKVWKVLVNSELLGPSLATVWSISCIGPHSCQQGNTVLYRIHKKIPSGIGPIYSRLLCGTFLPVSFPPMFDMRESFKECEGDLFFVGKIVNREITF
jgi:hypothetical protein